MKGGERRDYVREAFRKSEGLNVVSFKRWSFHTCPERSMLHNLNRRKK
jgi:hypothetical protein